MEKITDDLEKIFHAAINVTDDCMYGAIVRIDKQLGKGYAQKHPELICAFMSCAMKDLNTSIIASVIQDLGESIECGLENISGSIKIPGILVNQSIEETEEFISKFCNIKIKKENDENN